MAWLPGGLQHPFLRLIKCVVPGLGAWTIVLRRQKSHVQILPGAPDEMKLRTAITLNLSYKKSYYAVFGAFARVRSFRN